MTHVLYILMRTDMDSMNAGKGMAQASHASNAFVQHYMNAVGHKHKPAAINWQHDETTQGFGTVLVLGVNKAQMDTAVDIMDNLGYVAGCVFDPTYPLVDGGTVHFLPIETCGYIFVPDKEDDMMARAVLGNFSLHP